MKPTMLSATQRNVKYDQYGENWKQAEAFGGGTDGFGGFGGGGNPFEGFDFSGFTDGGGFSSFFQDLFGRGTRKHTSAGGRSARQRSGEMNATVNIDLYTALLGGEVLIALSSGKKLKLKVKPETQPGTKVRVRGKGYDRGDGTFGDLILTYNVTLPTHLTDHQKELLRQMRAG